MSINDLHDYKNVDLFEHLRMSDEDFEKNWLTPIGLLNGRMICICGFPMNEVTDSGAVKVVFDFAGKSRGLGPSTHVKKSV